MAAVGSDLTRVGIAIVGEFDRAKIRCSEQIISRSALGYDFSDENIECSYGKWGPDFWEFLNYHDSLSRTRELTNMTAKEDGSPISHLAKLYARTLFQVGECYELAAFAYVQALAQGVDKVAIIGLHNHERKEGGEEFTQCHFFTVIGVSYAEFRALAKAEKFDLERTLARNPTAQIVDLFFHFTGAAKDFTIHPPFAAYLEAHRVRWIQDKDPIRGMAGITGGPAKKAAMIVAQAQGIYKSAKAIAVAFVLGFDGRRLLCESVLKELSRIFPGVKDWGRCFAPRLAVWALLDKTVAQGMLEHLAAYGLKEFSIGEVKGRWMIRGEYPCLKALKDCPVMGCDPSPKV